MRRTSKQISSKATQLTSYLAVFVFALNSCSYYEEKNPRPLVELEDPGFNDVSSVVLQPRCLSCHGSGADIDLTTFDKTKENLDRVRRSIETDQMPPGGGLTPAQKKLILKWIANGAPENPKNPSPRPSPTPDPTPDPQPTPEPNYAWIAKNILEKKCTSCHSPEGKISYIDLSNHEAILKSETLIPGEPQNSPFYQVLVTEDVKSRMPPAKTGLAPVSSAEAIAVQQWILEGAKP
jgi:hypothetical protein